MGRNTEQGLLDELDLLRDPFFCCFAARPAIRPCESIPSTSHNEMLPSIDAVSSSLKCGPCLMCCCIKPLPSPHCSSFTQYSTDTGFLCDCSTDVIAIGWTILSLESWKHFDQAINECKRSRFSLSCPFSSFCALSSIRCDWRSQMTNCPFAIPPTRRLPSRGQNDNATISRGELNTSFGCSESLTDHSNV